MEGPAGDPGRGLLREGVSGPALGLALCYLATW